jgi:hypothetical protein
VVCESGVDALYRQIGKLKVENDLYESFPVKRDVAVLCAAITATRRKAKIAASRLSRHWGLNISRPRNDIQPPPIPTDARASKDDVMMNVSSDVYLWLHSKLSVKAARVCALLAVLGPSSRAGRPTLLPHSSMHRTALHKTGTVDHQLRPVTNARGTLTEAIPFRKQPARIIRYLMGLPILCSGVIAILSARCHLLAARPTASFGPVGGYVQMGTRPRFRGPDSERALASTWRMAQRCPKSSRKERR